jgi:hypothetical protein
MPCVEAVQERLPGRSRVTVEAGMGRGFQPAMARSYSSAFAVSVIPGNRRRNSMAADSSLCLEEVADDGSVAFSDNEHAHDDGSAGGREQGNHHDLRPKLDALYRGTAGLCPEYPPVRRGGPSRDPDGGCSPSPARELFTPRRARWSGSPPAAPAPHAPAWPVPDRPDAARAKISALSRAVRIAQSPRLGSLMGTLVGAVRKWNG